MTPTSGTLLCREAWQAKSARPGGKPQNPVRMTIHHTAATLGDNSNAPSRLRQHQSYHQDTQGWIDIAYHVSVDRNGNLYELRNPEIVGDTATSYDPTGHFLVVCEGNFDEEQVTEEQVNGAALAFAWAASKWQIPTDTLEGHRDASGDTACPGDSLYQYVQSGDLQRRIDTYLAAGPVELMRLCGPEAQQIVANIEAGM
ncbi:peptidoglycan recognition protein family protein [Mycolicibacterium novocastrense]|nr:peptidoglycan recognition protein family protein [Mycolicibacterium novocastrense]